MSDVATVVHVYRDKAAARLPFAYSYRSTHYTILQLKHDHRTAYASLEINDKMCERECWSAVIANRFLPSLRLDVPFNIFMFSCRFVFFLVKFKVKKELLNLKIKNYFNLLRKMEFMAPLEPTWEEFKDMNKYLNKLYRGGFMKNGITLVRAPKEYIDKLKMVNLKKDIEIKQYIEQKVESTMKNGIYSINYKAVEKDMDWQAFKNLFETKGENNMNYSSEEIIQQEIKFFWMELKNRCASKKNNQKQKPIIYANDLEKSLFPKELKEWNLGNLTKSESVIHKQAKQDWMPGVHTAYGYGGARNSQFAMHTEDCNLLSISYNFEGAPKIWYGIERNEVNKVIDLGNNTVNSACSHLLSHKCLMISPDALQEHDIKYKVVSTFYFKQKFF